MTTITINKITVEYEGQVTRWQKYGKDRLYVVKGGSIDLNEDGLKSTEFHNPYGWTTKRIVKYIDNQPKIVGYVHSSSRNDGGTIRVGWVTEYEGRHISEQYENPFLRGRKENDDDRSSAGHGAND